MLKETKQEQVPQEEVEALAEAPEEEQMQTTEIAAAEAPVQEEEAEEKAKPKRKKKDDEIVEERFYTIPLSRALVRPPKKRAPTRDAAN